MIFFSRGSSWPRDWTQVSCLAGRFSIYRRSDKPFICKVIWLMITLSILLYIPRLLELVDFLLQFLLFCLTSHCTRYPQMCLAHNWSFIIIYWTNDWQSYTNLLKKEHLQPQPLQYAYFKVRFYVFFCQKVCDVHLTFFVSLSADGTGLKKKKMRANRPTMESLGLILYHQTETQSPN